MQSAALPVENASQTVESSIDKALRLSGAPVNVGPESVSLEASAESARAILDAVQSQESQNPLDVERRELEAVVKRCTVMIVDEEEVNILMLRRYLRNSGYENFVTTFDSREAMRILRSRRPDLLLLDINMPRVSGMDILRQIQLDPTLRNIPVLVQTAETDPTVKRLALELGATDFLPKPLDPNEFTARVKNVLTMKVQFDRMTSRKEELETLVQKRTEELYQSRQQIILSLARAAEHRDNETGNHVLRVGCYAAIIAKQLGWPRAAVEMIQQAAQLHDVGKIGVPDNVLFKPGKLDDDEYALMKRHCALGKQIIAPYDAHEATSLRKHTGIGANILDVPKSPLMKMAARIAQCHHEHWDGQGYPLGLAGTDIPIEARITSVADVYDALSTKRPYKEPFAREKCFEIMSELEGTHFDPKVLSAFFACSEKIIEVQLAFMDEVPTQDQLL